MIAHAGLPNCYWAEAVSTAAYIRNRIPTRALKEPMTPYEMWYGRKPDVSHLRVFGCISYAHIPDAGRQKLDRKAKKLRFVGYSKVSKGYRLFDEEGRKVVIRRDVLFDETNFGSKTDQEPTKTKEVEPRRSERERRPPVRFGTDEYADTAATVEDDVCHVAYRAHQIEEPTTMEEALSSEHFKEWKAAADSEYESLMENDTWELVELPPGKNVIGSKWVFKVKYKSDGKLERFKGRLVAKRYLQRYGIDYDQTWRLIEKYGMTEAKIVSTPTDPSVKLEKDDGISKGVDPVTYQSMIGSLMYAATATRSDISFAVGVLSKFNSKPNESQMTAGLLTKPLPKGQFEQLRLAMGMEKLTQHAH